MAQYFCRLEIHIGFSQQKCNNWYGRGMFNNKAAAARLLIRTYNMHDKQSI